MGNSQHGLGRGLDALFRNGTLPVHENEGDVSELPIFKLTPGAGQPRQVFDDEALDELAASIRAQGIIQPILVRPVGAGNFEIIAGERRWRAAQKAGLARVPVIIRALSDTEAMTVALIENLQREDLNPLEEAQAIASLRDQLHLNQEDIADRIGKSRSSVANALRLLQLPEEVRNAMKTGVITPGHARALLSVPDDAMRSRLFMAVMGSGLSVRQTEDAAAVIRDTGALPDSILGGSGKPVRQRGPRAEKPADVKTAQLRLRAAVHPKATIAGTCSAGRITIPYDTPELFETILKALT